MQHRTKQWLKWGCGTLALIGVLFSFAVLWLAASLSGGMDEWLDFSHPTADDPEVVAARVVGADRVESELVRITEELAAPALGGARVARPVLVGEAATDEATHSTCEVGQHNWKRDDPYDLSCGESREALLVASSDSLAADLVALDAALVADGWEPDGQGLEAAVERATERERTGGTGMAPIDPTTLSYASYRRDADRAHLTLDFNPLISSDGPRATPQVGGQFVLQLTMHVQSFEE